VHSRHTHLGVAYLDLLAGGTTEAELRADYPLAHEDVLAAIAYAADRVRR
jgi:uncharacterized protein (DUF433 family)